MFAGVIAISIGTGCGAAPATGAPSQPVAADYRTWVYLTSGLGMSYGPAARMSDAPMFDTVFVDPAAHARFVATGAWPDRTTFVLEVRTSEHTGSIVTTGHYQTELAGVEMEVKDARLPGGWGFYTYDPASAAPPRLLPRTADCYACHAQHAAVENTFTQFYPTLFAVARARGTVRKDFPGLPLGADELYAQIIARGFAAARPALDAALARWPAASIAREATLNRLGYRLLATRPADAIAVLAEVTERFPRSANAWDSLAEACEAQHDLARARAATARGLAVLPDDPDRRPATEAALRARAGRLGS